MYENCRMLAADGSLLCHCDRKKVLWYVCRGIATLVSEEPLTIRLLFAHATADQAAGLDAFYAQSKLNRCVACGSERDYLR